MEKKIVKKNGQRSQIVEDFFRKTHSNKAIIDDVTRFLNSSHVQPDLIRKVRNMLVEDVHNEKHSFSRDNLSSQRLIDSTTPDSGHDRSHKSLENNAQIVIQIPKNQKISSIRIEFDQEYCERSELPLLRWT